MASEFAEWWEEKRNGELQFYLSLRWYVIKTKWGKMWRITERGISVPSISPTIFYRDSGTTVSATHHPSHNPHHYYLVTQHVFEVHKTSASIIFNSIWLCNNCWAFENTNFENSVESMNIPTTSTSHSDLSLSHHYYFVNPNKFFFPCNFCSACLHTCWCTKVTCLLLDPFKFMLFN